MKRVKDFMTNCGNTYMQFWNFFASGSGKKAAVAAAALSVAALSVAALTAAALVRAHKKRKYEQRLEARLSQLQAQDSAFENRFLKEYDAMADDPDAPVPPSHANVRETTPQGDVIMTYDAERRAFCYYSDTRSVQFKFLEPVARKYVLEHGCKRLHVDIRKELAAAEAKAKAAAEKAAAEKAAAEKAAAEKAAATQSQVKAEAQKKDSVFAQFKTYGTHKQPQSQQSQQPQGNRNQPQGNRNQPQGNRNQPQQPPNVQKEVTRYLHCGNLDEFAAVAVAAAAQEHDFSVIKPIDYASYKKMNTT
jgi:hypothetical protein